MRVHALSSASRLVQTVAGVGGSGIAINAKSSLFNRVVNKTSIRAHTANRAARQRALPLHPTRSCCRPAPPPPFTPPCTTSRSQGSLEPRNAPRLASGPTHRCSTHRALTSPCQCRMSRPYLQDLSSRNGRIQTRSRREFAMSLRMRLLEFKVTSATPTMNETLCA